MWIRLSTLLFALPLLLEARTCPLDRHAVDIQVTYKQYQTDHFWNKTGSRETAEHGFLKKETEVYGEFGLTCKDTLTFEGSWGRANEHEHRKLSGFSDLEFGWRRFLCSHGDKVFAMRALAIIPVETTFIPAIRYGRFGGELDALFGYKNWDFLLGYRYIQGFPSDQIRAQGEVRLPWNERISFLAQAKLDWGLFNGQGKKNASPFLFEPNYRLFKVKIEAEVKICSFISTNVGWFQHVWGENVGTSGGFYGGVDLQF